MKLKHFQVHPTFFIKILDKNTADELREFLINKNILIRNCSNYTGLNNKFFRIALKKRNENKLLLKNIKKFFNT